MSNRKASSALVPCNLVSTVEDLNHELDWQHHLANLRGFADRFGLHLRGLSLCLTIIGIPFGWQSIKLGFAVLAPFGKEVVEYPDANSPLLLIFNVIWLLLFGWPLVLNHLFWAVILAITIVGIPFAKQHMKLIILSLLPFGRDLR
jgi:uncharacterized membrane protein YccF (DUF307 family)